ncbi:threonyl-tRNA synthetase [Humibacillus xanthopallidus]|uniref:Threonine--tRNA ligase n=1 Tax=Humibacillus xanthopallidus TaxID=412689 RepID=A0A543PY13_9MICO|nr:threonine--tRNA ligase [Humibacillus xanthopallidus]TQN48962.1 threonyl-tRNA synthetase [Humibacillus xanthopallidus]
MPDHRDLNHDLDVFATDPLAGAGLPLWLPAGSVIRDELERLARDLAHADGCVGVHTPVLGKRALFEQSGHWAKFEDDMFPSMRLGEEEVVLRPANCPHHALVYSARSHSYRELPIRLNELAPMFRAERSGVLSGLTRVRQISLDDTHVFCRPDQAGEEAARGLRAALEAQRILGLPVHHVRLSLRDGSDAWLGSREQWEATQDALREAALEVLVGHDLPLVEAAGEAAFYGPKLDLQVVDARGHEETIATVQVDFNQPERFDLTYHGEDGGRHRVVMIHRGTVGSMERVTAALLERYDGRLPLWLAPVQVAVLPVSEQQDASARGLVDALRAEGVRVELAPEDSLGARIRECRRRRVTVLAVVGAREAADGAAQVTDVASGFRAVVPMRQLVERVVAARDHRRPLTDWA